MGGRANTWSFLNPMPGFFLRNFPTVSTEEVGLGNEKKRRISEVQGLFWGKLQLNGQKGKGVS